MSTGSKSTTTQQTQLSPEMQAAYSGILSQEGNLANSSYTGQLTAGMTPAQQQAVSQLSNISSTSSPYFAQANTALQAGTQDITAPQFSQAAVDQYMSPYESDVVNSTLGVLNQQDAQQLNQLRGSTAAAGALGGDRAGVAQAALQGQQDLANNQTIANLYNTGYGQALNQYNTVTGQQLSTAEANKQADLSAAGTYAGLGSADVSNQLASNEALMNAGTVQQQTAQNADTAAYQQYLQQYTNLADLGSVLGSAATATSPTTSTTTKNAPIIKAGGRVPHRADGGFLPAPDVSALNQRQPINLSDMRPGMPQTGDASQPSSLGSRAIGGVQGLSSLNTAVKGLGETGGLSGLASDIGSGAEAAGGAIADGASAAASGIGDGVMSLLALLKDGGKVPRLAMGGIPRITSDLLQSPLRHPAHAASVSGIGAVHPTNPVHLGSISVPHIRPGLADGGMSDDGDDVNVVHPVQVTGQRASLAALANSDRMASSAGVPAFWNDFATHSAPPATLADAATTMPQQNAPSQAQQPEDFWQRIGAAQGNGTGSGVNYKPGSPGWGMPLLAAIGAGLQSNNLGAAVSGGVGEYARESELDAKPTVDNSGPTSRIYYPSEKKWVDTGLPTEAAQYRQYQHDYQQQMIGVRQQTADQQGQAENDRAADRKTQLRIAEVNANAGKYTPIPMNGVDPAHPELGPVPGVMAFNQKTASYQFIPGYSKPDPNAPQPTGGATPWSNYGNSGAHQAAQPPPKPAPNATLGPDNAWRIPDPAHPGKTLKWVP